MSDPEDLLRENAKLKMMVESLKLSNAEMKGRIRSLKANGVWEAAFGAAFVQFCRQPSNRLEVEAASKLAEMYADAARNQANGSLSPKEKG